jgi:hypothetical protein
MNTSRISRASALGATCLVAVVALSGTAAAGTRRPTTTTTVPVPTTVPVTTTVPTSVPVPTAVRVVTYPANSFPYQFDPIYELVVSPATQLGDAEFVSGPLLYGPPYTFVGDFGRVRFGGIVANSDYVFRYRNKTWISSSGTFIYSPWVQLTFRSPSAEFVR